MRWAFLRFCDPFPRLNPFEKIIKNVASLRIPVFTNRSDICTLSMKLPKGQSRRDDTQKANRIAFPKLV